MLTYSGIFIIDSSKVPEHAMGGPLLLNNTVKLVLSAQVHQALSCLGFCNPLLEPKSHVVLHLKKGVRSLLPGCLRKLSRSCELWMRFLLCQGQNEEEKLSHALCRFRERGSFSYTKANFSMLQDARCEPQHTLSAHRSFRPTRSDPN